MMSLEGHHYCARCSVLSSESCSYASRSISQNSSFIVLTCHRCVILESDWSNKLDLIYYSLSFLPFVTRYHIVRVINVYVDQPHHNPCQTLVRLPIIPVGLLTIKSWSLSIYYSFNAMNISQRYFDNFLVSTWRKRV